MAKYNITERKEKAKTLSYRNSVSPEFVEEVAEKILTKLIVEKKYRDPKYSAKQLSTDIQVNSRHISVVISLRFQQNYSELVSRMRIYEAKYMLRDRNFDKMTMEDIAINVGFTTRQSFYAMFYKFCGITPKEYRQACCTTPEPKGKRKKAKK